MVREILRYLRVEDESGHLSLSGVALFIGVCCLYGSAVPFALALAACVHEQHLKAHQAELAMEQKHDLDVKAQGDSVADLAEKVEALIDKVQKVTSPERLADLKTAFGGKRA